MNPKPSSLNAQPETLKQNGDVRPHGHGPVKEGPLHQVTLGDLRNLNENGPSNRILGLIKFSQGLFNHRPCPTSK